MIATRATSPKIAYSFTEKNWPQRNFFNLKMGIK
jgi:hypothetical protein